MCLTESRPWDVGQMSESAPARIPWSWIVLIGVVFYTSHPHSLVASVELASRDALGAKEKAQAEENADNVGDGSQRRRASMLALACVSLASLARHPLQGFRIRGALGWSLIGLLALIAVSPVWADHSFLAFRRVVSLAFLMFGVLAVARRFRGEDLMILVVVVGMAFLAIGMIAELRNHTFKPWQGAYRFSGTLHPNRQGMNCSVIIIAALSLVLYGKHRWRYLAIAATAGIFLLLTGSRTSLGSAAAGVGVLWLLTGNPSRHLLSVFLAATCLLTALFAAALLEGEKLDDKVRDTLLMGRTDGDSGDGTLTGRVPLWEQCFRFAATRPLLGYGYKSFWTPERILKISNDQGWSVMAAHNGYIEMALNLGVVGLIVFTSTLATGIVVAIRTAQRTRTPAAAFAAAVLCWLAANSMLEAFLDEPLLVSFVSLTLLAMLGLVAEPQWGAEASPSSRNANAPAILARHPLATA